MLTIELLQQASGLLRELQRERELPDCPTQQQKNAHCISQEHPR